MLYCFVSPGEIEFSCLIVFVRMATRLLLTHERNGKSCLNVVKYPWTIQHRASVDGFENEFTPTFT